MQSEANYIVKHSLTPKPTRSSTGIYFNKIENERRQEGDEYHRSSEDVRPLK